MIKTFYLDEEIYSTYKTSNIFKKLDNLSKINIFIGSNNSGKSRLLRTLFSNENIKYESNEVDLQIINSIIDRLKKELEVFIKKEIFNDEEVIDRTTAKLERVHSLTHGLNLNVLVRQHFNDLLNYRGNLTSTYNREDMSIRNEITTIAKKYLLEFELASKDFPTDFKLRNMYIPTLRGMRRLDESGKDYYLTTTIFDYFKSAEVTDLENKIITGLKLNEDIKEHLLGSREQRKQVRDFENFLSETFFDNKEVNITPKTKGGVIHFMIGNEDKEIFNLGDGIQSIIILTYPLFFNQNKKMNFYIEEPEHYLHPGFQRIFIETLLMPQFENFQYFITTHSNHLLDITLDINQISIYTFKRKQFNNAEINFAIENVENENFNTLELIGVRNSSLFLSNSTIWVEGITDRIYLRAYLDIYQKDKKIKFTEDVHYSFVEYGGNNITHWSFLESEDPNHKNIDVERVCAKLFLISDKDDTDNQGSKKAIRQKKLSEKLGERYYCLQAREIENILLPKIIKNVIQDYEKFNPIKYKESFDEVDFATQPLGTFIDENIENSKRSFADKSGTIKDKINFAKKAVGFINKIEDMSEEAKILSDKLYNFISSQNN